MSFTTIPIPFVLPIQASAVPSWPTLVYIEKTATTVTFRFTVPAPDPSTLDFAIKDSRPGLKVLF